MVRQSDISLNAIGTMFLGAMGIVRWCSVPHAIPPWTGIMRSARTSRQPWTDTSGGDVGKPKCGETLGWHRMTRSSAGVAVARCSALIVAPNVLRPAARTEIPITVSLVKDRHGVGGSKVPSDAPIGHQRRTMEAICVVVAALPALTATLLPTAISPD